MNILLTAATSYIGRRPKHKLLKENEVKPIVFLKGIKKTTKSWIEASEILSYNPDIV